MSCFVDGNYEKYGCMIEGKAVTSPEELKNMCDRENVVVIITVNINTVDEIINKIKELNIVPNRVYTEWGVRMGLINNANSKYIDDNTSNMLKAYKNAFVNYGNAYDLYSETINIKEVFFYGYSAMRFAGVISAKKTASMSVFRELANVGYGCFHLHYMVDVDKLLVQQLIQKRCIKLITLVRDPISRDMSNFFFDIAYENNKLNYLEGLDKDNIYQTIKNRMREQYRCMYGVAHYYEKEFLSITGIDVLKYQFDKSKGYEIIKNGNVEVMVIRMESLNNVEEEIAKYLEVEEFKIGVINTGDEIGSKYAYKQFKENVVFTPEELNYYYDNDAVRHFYTDEQIEKFKKKWGRY